MQKLTKIIYFHFTQTFSLIHLTAHYVNQTYEHLTVANTNVQLANLQFQFQKNKLKQTNYFLIIENSNVAIAANSSASKRHCESCETISFLTTEGNNEAGVIVIS